MDWTFHPTLVKPFYLLAMNANVLSEPAEKQGEFMASLCQVSDRVPDDELRQMLRSSWRPAKVAAWLVALGRREQFVSQLEAMLLDRPDYVEHVCIALAALGASSSPGALQVYLDRCVAVGLAPGDERGERLSPDWAVAAIEHIGDASQVELACEAWSAFLEIQQRAIPRFMAERGFGSRLRDASQARRVNAKTALAGAVGLLADRRGERGAL